MQNRDSQPHSAQVGGERQSFGLSTLEDIIQVILQSEGLSATLQNIVRLVATRMQSEVCSVYLLENDRLVLRATEGLSPSSIGKASLRIGEGLVGYTAEQGSVINLRDPENHPKYRYIAGSNEERFHSFLGIPVYDRSTLLGVMAIQTVSARLFSDQEVSTLRTIAFQVSTVIANARLLDSFRTNAPAVESPTDDRTPSDSPPFLIGSSLGDGVCAASAYLCEADATDESSGETIESSRDTERERTKLHKAIEQSKIETLCLQKAVTARLSDREGDIFQTHLMMLQDRQFLAKMEHCIQTGNSAIESVRTVVSEYRRAFSQIPDPFLRSRVADIEDVGKRIQLAISGNIVTAISLEQPSIIVADDLLPSQLVTLPMNQIKGFILESEHSNGHAAIIAKSVGIPTLYGVRNATRRIHSGDSLILDAKSGRVYINPDSPIRTEYDRLIREQKVDSDSLDALTGQPAKSNDGHLVTLRANLGLLSDLPTAKKMRAEGVGLYRTEFPFMSRSDFPNRSEQVQLYRKILEEFPEEPVTFRTLDIGGDKTLPYVANPKETNPFLGWRSIRISLELQEVFQTQIEAILIASHQSNARIMFPMVTSVEEFEQCLKIMERARQKLTAESIPFGKLPVGVMVETPATVAIAKHLAPLTDFFSIGTNDLIQYLLAADRTNPKVSNYYDPLHPAVLDSINNMMEIANAAEVELCICGEMASDPQIFPLLVGMGVHVFSVSAPLINRMKAALLTHSYTELKTLADDVLALPTSSKIRDRLGATLR